MSPVSTITFVVLRTLSLIYNRAAVPAAEERKSRELRTKGQNDQGLWQWRGPFTSVCAKAQTWHCSPAQGRAYVPRALLASGSDGDNFRHRLDQATQWHVMVGLKKIWQYFFVETRLSISIDVSIDWEIWLVYKIKFFLPAGVQLLNSSLMYSPNASLMKPRKIPSQRIHAFFLMQLYPNCQYYQVLSSLFVFAGISELW